MTRKWKKLWPRQCCPASKSLLREVIMCLRYCSVTFRGQAPREVILSGGRGDSGDGSAVWRNDSGCGSGPVIPFYHLTV